MSSFNIKNKLIFIQWTNNVGGLERITQIYEKIFYSYNPLVAVLRKFDDGIKYKNNYFFKHKDKLLFVLEYLSFIRKRKDSIFHIQYSGSYILLLTYLAGARKLIFHFHGTKFPSKFIDKLIWKILQNKILIISNSLYTENVIKEKLNIIKPIKRIPNLIDLENFQFKKKVYNQNKFIITYAGRFNSGKNINVIIEVAKVLQGIDNSIEFLIVGDGPEKNSINNLIKNYKLESKITLLEFTNDIKEIYNQSNLFIFLSSYESFGNVIAEAILSGLPVLCYKIPALTELIIDEYFFVDTLDSSVIVPKIIDFIDKYDEVIYKLEKVNQFLREYLNNKKVINELEIIYTSFN